MVATRVWVGSAPPIAKTVSYAFAGTWIVNETISISYGLKTAVFTVPSTSISAIVAAFTTWYNAMSPTVFPEFAEQTAAGTATPWTLTAKTAGMDFAPVVTTNSASGTITPTTTVANSGPNAWDAAENWSGSTVPCSAAATPVQSAASAVSGGALISTVTYYWVVTALNPNGETVVSNEQTLTISSPNQTAVISWGAAAGATGYRIYRSTTSNTYPSGTLVASVGLVTTYSDLGAGTVTGGPPGSSTALADNVVIDRANVQIYWGLGQSAVLLASLTVNTPANDQAFVLGLPKTNTGSGTPYPEYRPDYLQIGATVASITTLGGRTKVAFGTAATTCTVYTVGSTKESGIPACLLNGPTGNASNVFNVLRGVVGAAFFGGETLQGALNQGRLTSNNDSQVVLGSGYTISTIVKTAGTLTVNSAVGTSAQVGGGSTTINGTGAVAQLNGGGPNGGDAIAYNTSGALGGNTVLANGSLLDMSQTKVAPGGLTVTNPISCYDSADVNDPNKVVSGLAVTYVQTGRGGFGTGYTVTRS